MPPKPGIRCADVAPQENGRSDNTREARRRGVGAGTTNDGQAWPEGQRRHDSGDRPAPADNGISGDKPAARSKCVLAHYGFHANPSEVRELLHLVAAPSWFSTTSTLKSPKMRTRQVFCAAAVICLPCCTEDSSRKTMQVPVSPAVTARTPPGEGAPDSVRYTLSDLMAMQSSDTQDFLDALTVWIRTASDDDLARLYSELSQGRKQGFAEIMVAHAPSKALDFARRHVKGVDSSNFASRAFHAILKAKPAEAAKLALDLPAGTLRRSAFLALVGFKGWHSYKGELIARSADLFPEEQAALGEALVESAAAVEMLQLDLLQAPPLTRKAFAQTLAARWVEENNGSLEALTAQLPDDLKAPATEYYFMRLSSTNPQAALALATQLGRKEVDVAARTWAGSDPVAAAEFFAASPEFESGLSQVFDHWLGVAPLEASKYASTQLKGRAAELAAAEIVEECLEHGDKAGAEKWLQTITDPDLKKAASSR